MRTTLLSLLIAAGFAASAAQAAPLMSAEWAAQACQYWNTNPALTTELAEKWAKNDGGRGYSDRDETTDSQAWDDLLVRVPLKPKEKP